MPPRSDVAGDDVDVAIIGAGVSGLCASWRLQRAGTPLRVAHFELADNVGGTSSTGPGNSPWGAHYITLPNVGARHVRTLLSELGVIQGFFRGRPQYDPTALCFAPQERLFDGSTWVEGLWPTLHASAEDQRQAAAFDDLVARYQRRVGADGRMAFDIPVHNSSLDPDLRRLAAISFADWLDTQGLDAPMLRWSLRYGTRDDFGTELHDTSAWAGLHYHCARRPDPAGRDLGTQVLTWPAGNGWLVEQLVARSTTPVTTGATVLQIEPEDHRVRMSVLRADGTMREVTAACVIAAIPTRVVSHLMDLGDVMQPDLAPWRVAALQVDQPPRSRGVQVAWDSVLLHGEGLGYVSNAHQRGTYGGPSVLTYYEPLSTVGPAVGRQALLDSTWEQEVDRVLRDLAPAHPDLRRRISRIDVRHWGHGTTRPVVGLHTDDRLLRESRPHPRVWLAHTDRSGMSLFEEASWHGVRSAEQALEHLGHPVVERLW